MTTERVGTDVGPVHELPLPSELVALLESLEPIRAVRHHKYPDRTPLSARAWQPVGEITAFPVPTLSALGGQRELAAVTDRAVSVLYLPDDRLLNLGWDDALARGATHLTASFDHLWEPTTAPGSTRRSPASGDSTVLDVRGHLVGVQCRSPRRTRLAWAVRNTDLAYDAEVWAGRPPREAVELLVASEHP